MKTSMRIMFLALIAAMAVGYAQLRSHNAALEAQATAVTP